MREARDTLLTLALGVLVFAGPVSVAAYILAADDPQAAMMLAASGVEESASTTGSAEGDPAAAALLTGMLYTRGAVQIDWNGVKIPVRDGRYAYLGGELITTGTRDIGVLQLDGDNRVYVCPDSRMSVARSDESVYRIGIFEGSGRFAFAAGTHYRIEANRAVLTPGAGADSRPTVVEVSVFDDHPGGVVCGFSSSTDVAGYPVQGDGAPIALGTAAAGEIIDLSRALRDEAAGSGTPVLMHPIQMPASVQSWLRENAPYPPEPGPIGYLCRCEELKRYAEADGIPEAAIVPRVSPPDSQTTTLLPRTDTPPALPLSPPAVVLAEPGPPNPADAAVLPDVSGIGVLSVPPPLVPTSGSGGGVTSTPS